MARRMVVALILMLGVAGIVSSKEAFKPTGVEELRAASTRAMKVTQQSQAGWFEKQTCTSCHHQLLPEKSLKLARERAIPVDETIARKHSAAAFAYLDDADSIVQGYDFIDVAFNGISLVAADWAGFKPTVPLAAEAQFVAGRQLADGSWTTFDERPPQSSSLFSVTANCAQALQKYLPASLDAERESRVARARAWLLKNQPQTTEDRTYQLLGLQWTGAAPAVRQRFARRLLAEQREDGGWAQLPDLPSDAYSTGEVLSALHEAAGLATASPAYQRGLRFLLSTQQADGSWRVKTRLHPPAPVSPPYFESGFPYAKDQFVSIMGTNWALVAMLHAIPPSAAQPRHSADAIAIADVPEWARVTITGTVAELRKLLNSGMDPNSKTAGGTSALMMAVHDPEKVKLLLDRGANASARAESGLTALMVAARQRGSAPTLRMLLSKGAKPNSEKAVEVRNQASALFFAATAGDLAAIKVLLDAGARPNEPMKMLGTFLASPFNYAVTNGDLATVNYLLERGADANETDAETGISQLGWAAIGNRTDVLQSLIAHGAKVNHVDKLGMTPLLYAASIDWGDTTAMKKLIAAGADTNAKTKEGLTALDLVQKYHHPRMTSLLSAKVVSR